MRSFRYLLAAAAAQVVAGSELALYWGANDSERSLGDYCSEGAADILILSFLYYFGDGQFPHGYFGDCTINSDGSSSGCDNVINDINTCHSQGKKIFIALGGGGATGHLTGKNDATGVAYSLWNSFARPEHTSNSPRPLGDAYVDGWDMDIEDNTNNWSQDYLGTMINALRGYFPNDGSHTYYISGAPQCPHPDENMGNSMMEAQYDYLWIQFYNNFCAAADLVKDSNNNPDGSGGSYNFNEWPAYLSGGQSKNAKLHVGLPGSKSETPAGNSFDYVPTYDLPTVLSASNNIAGYNGFMIFDAGDSDMVNVNGCHYDQQVKRVMTTGKTC